MALTADEQAKLDALKIEYAAIGDAILVILRGAQQYTLDTGQSRQTVTKGDIGSLRLLRNEVESQIDALEAKSAGTRTYHGRPGF